MRTSTLLAATSVVALLSTSAFAQTITLGGTVRDFTPSTNLDFEYTIADDRGIVSTTLGPGRIPTYAGGSHPTIHSAATFSQWFTNTPGVNIPIATSITLSPIGGGIYSYSNPAFFPIDGMGFGNYGGYGHNFHFTFALNSSFTYQGGETFSFSGDDDIWVFLNNKLAIDLGGIHPTESASVSLDSIASTFGMTAGGVYNFDFFFAERHTTGSNFRMDTNLVLSSDPRTGVPEPGEWAAMGILATGLGGLILRARRRKA